MHSLNTIKEQNKSNAKKLIDLTLKNGGSSFNCDLEVINFKKGFAVSTWEISQTSNLESLEKKLNRFPSGKRFNWRRSCNEGQFYGLWIDDNRVFHLDRCDLISDYYQAVQLGKDNAQKAIYDFKNEIEINLEGGK